MGSDSGMVHRYALVSFIRMSAKVMQNDRDGSTLNCLISKFRGVVYTNMRVEFRTYMIEQGAVDGKCYIVRRNNICKL